MLVLTNFPHSHALFWLTNSRNFSQKIPTCSACMHAGFSMSGAKSPISHLIHSAPAAATTAPQRQLSVVPETVLSYITC